MEQSAVLRNMQIIEDIFREVQELFPTLNEEELVARLESYPLQFRSIAYEAASMQYALQDLKAALPLTGWQNFVNTTAVKHTTQCYIGLGWAFAQEQLNPTNYLSLIHEEHQLKVFDGYGYYEGMFRKRKSIVQMQLPALEGRDAFYSYDCGLGRSLWYSEKGEIVPVAKIAAQFPKERQGALWTGLGTAIAYVGGCTPEMLRSMVAATGAYTEELVTGLQAAAISRNKAETDLSEVLNALRVFDEQGGKALEAAKSFLGKQVAVIFDRPMGSVHPEAEFIYPLNYGYIPDTVSGDGEELDAYYIGAHTPLEKVIGYCIAVIHRFKDKDDKLIVVPQGTTLTNEEIRRATAFQERWFSSIVITQ